MPEFDLSPAAQTWVNGVFLWIGFATVVGVLVRSFLPGKEPGGLVGTLMIGSSGCCLGPLALTLLFEFQNETFNPIGLIGFAASVAAATVILLCYRATIGFFPRKAE
ncbi:MAG TPA: transglycosylase [Planctomycetaceae bacterium]|nr:transglycosylase [Planctomycetaceae bacterium]